ncbi:St14 [Acrasis kona]|uniref:St14 n=1 Tax=Acrasis kona TaxID=1008807 RepID=A0AAW2ZDK4_9EUKA
MNSNKKRPLPESDSDDDAPVEISTKGEKGDDAQKAVELLQQQREKAKKQKKQRIRRFMQRDELNLEDDELLDPSILDKVVQEENEEANAVTLRKNAKIEKPESIVKTIPEPKRARIFRDFKVVAVVAPSRDPLSVPRQIDPSITEFLNAHFYGRRIKRVSTAKFHSDKSRDVAAPSAVFVNPKTII